MTHTKTKAAALALGGVLLFATAAWAGTWVNGYGSTRTRAMDDADTRAQRMAQAGGRCYRQARGEDCRQADGEWVCRAEVTHHNTSNPGGVCPA